MTEFKRHFSIPRLIFYLWVFNITKDVEFVYDNNGNNPSILETMLEEESSLPSQ